MMASMYQSGSPALVAMAGNCPVRVLSRVSIVLVARPTGVEPARVTPPGSHLYPMAALSARLKAELQGYAPIEKTCAGARTGANITKLRAPRQGERAPLS